MNSMTEANKGLINLVFLGCGKATRIHSKTLAALDDRVVRYYASRAIEKAESFNRKFGGRGIFGSYDAAIQAENIDAVLIATPPKQHLELTLKAIKAGKHVIVEKPPFLKAEDFASVREAQKQTDCRLFVAENYFYKPLAYKLRELIKSEVIGEVLFVHINALKLQVMNEEDWRSDLELSGGGALFEGGIHWINFVANLGLNLKTVSGFLPGGKMDRELSVLVALGYEDGAVGSLYYSWETPSLFKGLRISKIYGREGSITFESNGLFILVRGRKKRLIFPGVKDIAGYKGMFRDFIASIREGREPLFNLDLAERDLKLIEDIYQSISSN